MTSQTITAAAAGSWTLGDLTVRRIGFGAMRLAQTGPAPGPVRSILPDQRASLGARLGVPAERPRPGCPWVFRRCFQPGCPAARADPARSAGQGLVPGAVPRDRAQALGVLRRAVELGVNHIDTAAFYFSPLRSANELINRALAPYPEDLVIATKVGQPRDPSGAWLPHAGPDRLRGRVEENLRQLGRDHLDLVNLRVVGAGPIAERFGALAELRTAGLVRHLGLSNVLPHHLAEAQAIAPVVCVQNMYGLGVRPEQDAFVGLCRARGVAFVPFYAIAADGRQHGAAGRGEHPAVVEVARAHGVSPARVRIAWTLHRGPHVLAIPGTGDPAHLAADVAAGALRLSAAELDRLDALHRAGAGAGSES